MKSIGINSPCSENWNEMTANEKGAFCQKCASQVYDFTQKTSAEIKQTLHSLIGQNVCGRMTQKQEDDLNAEFEAWILRQRKHSFQQLLVFTLLVVFGLSLFSCKTPQDQQKIETLQQSVMKVVSENPVHDLFSEALNVTKGETNQDIILGKVAVLSHDIEEQKIIDVKEIADEQQIMGDLFVPNDFFEEGKNSPIIPVQEIEPCYIKGEINISGGISSVDRYTDYLVDTVKPVTTSKIRSAFAFPNPTTHQTTLQIEVPDKTLFEIKLVDLSGKVLQNIHQGELEKGTFRKEINLSDLQAGVYLITIFSNNTKESVRVLKN